MSVVVVRCQKVEALPYRALTQRESKFAHFIWKEKQKQNAICCDIIKELEKSENLNLLEG